MKCSGRYEVLQYFNNKIPIKVSVRFSGKLTCQSYATTQTVVLKYVTVGWIFLVALFPLDFSDVCTKSHWLQFISSTFSQLQIWLFVSDFSCTQWKLGRVASSLSLHSNHCSLMFYSQGLRYSPDFVWLLAESLPPFYFQCCTAENMALFSSGWLHQRYF